MPKKRRNGGRSRHGRGKTCLVDCGKCQCNPPKDKAVARFKTKNLVDQGVMNDMKAASVYGNDYELPKIYEKSYHCISCAVHSRIVRVRNREARRIRTPPRRFRRPSEGRSGPGGADKKPTTA